MSAVVIDTNVAVVANGRSEQASPACVLACIDALQRAIATGPVVLDDGMDILAEYMNHLSMSGQPGVGDHFMKWVWQNQGVADRCERVAIHTRSGSADDYVEFPEDPGLVGFDPKDRKFVAVALTSPHHPPILNAVDSDWWTYAVALKGCGVTVKNICGCGVQRSSG